jgi:hypothetical protein
MWKKPQGTPKNTTGKVFSSNSMKPHLYFAVALRGQADQQLHQEAAASASNRKPPKTKQQEPGQSVLAPSVNSEPLDNMFRTVTVVKEIMAELMADVAEEAKILAITKMLFNLMKKDGK